MPSDPRPTRPIDLRRQQKRANHDAMLAAAADLFGTAGYQGTTMEAVAAASGMSVQSVYFAFHSKAELLQATLDRASQPPTRRHLDPDPDAALTSLVADACRVLEETGALALAAATAAPGDEAAAGVHRVLDGRRARAAAELVQRLRARRPLAPRVTARGASDVVYGLLSPQLYALMVRERGWSRKRYAAWAAGAIGRALWG